MEAKTTIEGKEITITTEHATSSYDIPVVLIDGEITDIPAEYEPDRSTFDWCYQSPIYIALCAMWAARGGWQGAATIRALVDLADQQWAKKYGSDWRPAQITAQDVELSISDFEAEGKRLRQAEEKDIEERRGEPTP